MEGESHVWTLTAPHWQIGRSAQTQRSGAPVRAPPPRGEVRSVARREAAAEESKVLLVSSSTHALEVAAVFAGFSY